MNKVFKVGLIGCGHISETYFRGHDYFNNFIRPQHEIVSQTSFQPPTLINQNSRLESR